METFADYLETIDDTDHRATLRDVIEQIQVDNSGLKLEIKWNQPMLTDHGTFIMGFSVAKKHFSIAPERLVLDEFRSQIDSAGYDLSKALMKVQWDQK
ncbi:MAG: iron chaperone [Canibacter sp.]